MKNQIKALVAFLFLSGILNAQTNFSITGKLIDKDQKPGIGIQITLLQAKDNSIVKIEISDNDGNFSFSNLNENDYKLLVEDIGFKRYQSEIISLNAANPNRNLPPISLTTNDLNKLDEVVITKKKPFVENKIDRTVVNVDAFITAAGGDAMDILEKSPGISVDQNGTITFKGKSGVQVFIDDKPTYLSGAELEAYLKSLPASTLDKIELMTNPPAKYDAAGGAGIINIVSKRSKTKGFNGNLTSRVSQGKRSGNRQGLNFNYMNNKIRLFGNIGFAEQNPINDLFIFRKFKDNSGNATSLFYQNSFIDTKVQSKNARIGLDYYLSDKTTIGLGLSGILRNNNQNSDVRSEITDANSVLDSSIIAYNKQKQKFKNGGITLNFRHELDSLGQRLTVDVDYLKYDTAVKQTFNNYIYQPDNTLSSQDELKGDLPSDIDIYSLKSDYTLPMKNGSTFEAGYKVSYTKTDNIADYRDVINNEEIPNYATSNHFKYDEIINAAYVNFSTNYKRFSFQTGLRVENTESKGNQLGNIEQPASKFKRNYTNLFPTVYVQYKLDSIGDNSLVINYGRRINRPYFQDLNPFVSPLDRFTFYSGNPFLNPSFANNYELSYRYKSIFSTTLSYGASTDDINETIEINDGIYYSRPGNIGKSEFFSLNASLQLELNKWWSTNIYNEVTHTRYKSKLYTEDLESSGTFWSININNSFKFQKGWSAELSGNYHTDIISAQFVILSRSSINIGVQKKILQDKATIKLSGNDIFYSNLNNGIIRNLQNTEANWRNKLDSRFVALTFTYSFGKSFAPKKQYDANGAESEKNRVKS
ncbi:outer membrane beta-barrel family protein [Flavobacterium sp. 102]|uniref:outer membrane beta-barrel family protein n=2 Tax=unclassified Flavobacterium TaxID=196869 RepID=UPI000F1EFA25|nr:outer membrane beta-barrel family protein [Flavobacterium sp. 102]RKS02541.1 outer membrane receptor protein involved in Fe transport [Flavobacterium sp. 102]